MAMPGVRRVVKVWTFTLLGVLAAGVIADVWFTAQALELGIPEANPVAGTIIDMGGLKLLIGMKIVLLLLVASYLGMATRPNFGIVVVLAIASVSYMAMTVLHLIMLGL